MPRTRVPDTTTNVPQSESDKIRLVFQDADRQIEQKHNAMLYSKKKKKRNVKRLIKVLVIILITLAIIIFPIFLTVQQAKTLYEEDVAVSVSSSFVEMIRGIQNGDIDEEMEEEMEKEDAVEYEFLKTIADMYTEEDLERIEKDTASQISISNLKEMMKSDNEMSWSFIFPEGKEEEVMRLWEEYQKKMEVQEDSNNTEEKSTVPSYDVIEDVPSYDIVE